MFTISVMLLVVSLFLIEYKIVPLFITTGWVSAIASAGIMLFDLYITDNDTANQTI